MGVSITEIIVFTLTLTAALASCTGIKAELADMGLHVPALHGALDLTLGSRLLLDRHEYFVPANIASSGDRKNLGRALNPKSSNSPSKKRAIGLPQPRSILPQRNSITYRKTQRTTNRHKAKQSDVSLTLYTDSPSVRWEPPAVCGQLEILP